MHTEVGLLSWVSHTTIARAIGINKDAVRCYLRAATLIGAVKVKYTYAEQHTDRPFGTTQTTQITRTD